MGIGGRIPPLLDAPPETFFFDCISAKVWHDGSLMQHVPLPISSAATLGAGGGEVLAWAAGVSIRSGPVRFSFHFPAAARP